MSVVLVIDIGNTSTSIGAFSNGRIIRKKRIPTPESTPSAVKRLVEAVVGRLPVNGTAIASVVPTRTPVWLKIARPYGRIVHVDAKSELGIGIDYPDPSRIGADRLVNASAGAQRYGSPLIIADFGTAVTFDCVTRTRGYIGGIIAPGLPLMFDYLADRTALLPRITPARVRDGVGRNTRTAMQLGARWGYRGMVREIVHNLLTQPGLRNATLVATGGYAKWVVEGLSPPMIVDEDLTLYGLATIFEMNT